LNMKLIILAIDIETIRTLGFVILFSILITLLLSILYIQLKYQRISDEIQRKYHEKRLIQSQKNQH
jgi:hypothetical protein